MKIKRIISSFLFICVMFFSMISCEGGTHREWYVTNNSSTNIFVEIQNIGSDLQKDTIEPGETKLTTFYSSYRGAHSRGIPTQELNSFLLYNDTDTTTKDGLLEDNWLVESEKTSNVPADYTHVFTYFVTDSDF